MVLVVVLAIHNLCEILNDRIMEITRQQKNNITPLSEVIDKRVGRPGTEKRETFDKEVENLVIGLRIEITL